MLMMISPGVGLFSETFVGKMRPLSYWLISLAASSNRFLDTRMMNLGGGLHTIDDLEDYCPFPFDL